MEITCPRSIYEGPERRRVRVWGRRRLHVLERLIPVARKFTVHLLGDGLPSFYVADLGDMSFTLGLSGWTANDWSRLGNFDLLAPRGAVDEITLRRVYAALTETWCESSASLARRLHVDEAVPHSRAESRAAAHVPATLQQRARSQGRAVRQSHLVKVQQQERTPASVRIAGAVLDNAVSYQASMLIDDDQRLQEAGCECFFWKQNRLRKGPCEHILALRRAS